MERKLGNQQEFEGVVDMKSQEKSGKSEDWELYLADTKHEQ